MRVGLVLALVGVCSTLVSAALVGPAVKRMGERGAILSGLLFGVVGFCMYGMASTSGLFLSGMPFVALWTIAGPALQVVATRHVDPTEQGRLHGAFSSMRGISGMTGALLFTQTFAMAIGPGRALHLPGAPYLLAAALLAASLLVCMNLTKIQEDKW